MEKSYPGQEGHPPSRVNFTARLDEKKVDPFARAKSWQQSSHMLWLSRLEGVDPARRAKVSIWRKVGPARRVTLPSQKGDPAGRVTLLAEPTFCFSCKRLPSFVRKCMKSWLAQGSWGRRVTLLPGTTFLHINGALERSRKTPNSCLFISGVFFFYFWSEIFTFNNRKMHNLTY